MNQSTISFKRRKLENDGVEHYDLAEWDNEDIFTVEQLDELDLLATQAYQELDQTVTNKQSHKGMVQKYSIIN